MAADPELIALFARGWAMTRGVAPPVARLGGHYIHVGQPDQAARYVFPQFDRTVIAGLGRTIRDPWIYLKVCEEPETVCAALPPQWQLRETPTFMMTAPLAERATDLAAGYRLSLMEDGELLRAAVLVDGFPVAQGRIALLDDTALFDQIATDERHRRRGLGRTLMQALSNGALARGASRGLLSATEMGRGLYETIGWTVHSPYTSAVIPA
ncbi:MAG TPA: GNAT family N-acetyltransferase [Sphingomonas sp.]|uniref:GNAT family N-acetyltransferase n=1 Tax=Sphingomonas sp. TaxID=28214 RepID=UPI002BC8F0AC|nr:GNAT family N-acetyltransferase [Sphingomonas sp.]HMI19976.1 GNAT family N-acetyltransferase [Sphingomonas sp.]